MSFNPTEPKNGEVVDADLLRTQFNSLKALIDALDVRITALETRRRGLIFNGLDNYAVNPAIAWPAAGTFEFWLKVTGPISDLWPGVAGDNQGLPGTDYNTTGLPSIEFYGAGTINVIGLAVTPAGTTPWTGASGITWR